MKRRRRTVTPRPRDGDSSTHPQLAYAYNLLRVIMMHRFASAAPLFPLPPSASSDPSRRHDFVNVPSAWSKFKNEKACKNLKFISNRG